MSSGSAATPTVVKVRALFCPNCGASVELRGFGHTLTAVCEHCLSVLDASEPSLKILQQIPDTERRTPLIPLGSRGKLRGALWEVIGFQTRGAEDWEWAEYVLFNPYHGFRYLTEYRGHWNLVSPVRALPEGQGARSRPLFLGGRSYRFFSSAAVSTTFVLGEFPWRVRVGEQVRADDFISPPLILSGEITEQEITWSLGEYMSGQEIWQAFSLPDRPPAPTGIFANQPSPFAGKVSGLWYTWLMWLAALVVLAILVATFTARKEAFRQKYSFSPAAQGEASFVTPIFELTGRTTTLELTVRTNVQNDWIYFNFALVNEGTGEAYDFGREIGYYAGRDSDGAWSEGRRSDNVLIPSVAPGRYYLRVEPEMDPRSSRARSVGVSYEIILRHDVPAWSFFWIAGLLLLIPPIIYTIRAHSFEKARFAEAGVVTASDDNTDED